MYRYLARATSLAGLLRALSHWSWWLGLVLGVPGLLLRDPKLVSVAGVFLPLGFLLDDVARGKSGGITAMTAYSGSAIATSVANTAALLAADTPDRWKYYLYVSEPNVFLAMCLALAAAVVPPFIGRLASGKGTAGVLRDMLPKVRGEIADGQLVGGGVAVGLLAVVFHWQFPAAALGTLNNIVFLMPLFVAFVLARAGTERNVRGALSGALAVAVAEAIRAALFGYLRGDAVAPIVAFVLGTLAGDRSLRPLKSRVFMPVYALMALFVAYFGAYGAMRAHAAPGLQRIEAVVAYRDNMREMSSEQDQTVLSRLTTVNQLSQVGRLAESGGFLNGQTLSYLWYAFIPRFLWRDKPSIASGAWFALQIGQANVGPDGTIRNSVNMTIPGELYLNFGWTGVFVGLAFLGVFITALWRTTEFWRNSRNVLGSAFAFYLAWPWIGFSLGADLQILVTLIAVYLVLLVAGWFLPALRRHSRLMRSHSLPAASA